MVITFCGHSQFFKTKEIEEKLLEYLAQVVGDEPAEMFLGGYGEFDNFAYECCKKYKETHSNVKLVFVTPYITESYQKNCLEYQTNRYDLIIYPEIENKPPKFAIIYRNRYMVDKADLVIAYVKYTWGGAYTSLKYAKKKNKKIFNLAE